MIMTHLDEFLDEGLDEGLDEDSYEEWGKVPERHLAKLTMGWYEKKRRDAEEEKAGAGKGFALCTTYSGAGDTYKVTHHYIPVSEDTEEEKAQERERLMKVREEVERCRRRARRMIDDKRKAMDEASNAASKALHQVFGEVFAVEPREMARVLKERALSEEEFKTELSEAIEAIEAMDLTRCPHVTKVLRLLAEGVRCNFPCAKAFAIKHLFEPYIDAAHDWSDTHTITEYLHDHMFVKIEVVDGAIVTAPTVTKETLVEIWDESTPYQQQQIVDVEMRATEEARRVSYLAQTLFETLFKADDSDDEPLVSRAKRIKHN